MINKIVAIQGNHPAKLNPKTDTSVFLANEVQKKKYRIFFYDPKDLSIINSKVIAKGFFIKFNYNNKKFYKILKKQKLDLVKCRYILIRQDPPFNLEYISTTYILERIKKKVKIINDPTSIRNVSEKLYSVKYQKFMPSTIFLKETSDKKTWISVIVTFAAILYIFFDSLKLGNFYGDILGFITAIGLAVGAITIRSAKSKNLVPAAVVGKLFVATFALFFIESFALTENDLIIVPLMCILCVAIPFVLVTIAPRFIPAAEVNLFFLLETIIGPIWVWLIIKEQPSFETILGGAVIVATIAFHSFLKLRNS